MIKNRCRLLGTVVLLFLAAAVLGTAGNADACAPAPPFNAVVEIADESAIILWDAPTKTEHFIRRASFHTQAHDFGFLVPTPTKPVLAEAGDKAFTELARITAPREVTMPRPLGGISCACSKSARPPGEVAEAVRVLDEQRVAGYDAVVLEADAPDALSKWLKEHGYEFSPALADWAAPYIKAGWKVTAFKVAKAGGTSQDTRPGVTSQETGTNVATSAVRMTFQTDRPFFPYREPATQATAGQPNARRLLRVFFLGDKKVEGTLEKESKPRHGRVVWANSLAAADSEKLLHLLKLPAETPPPAWWLTEFEDPSSPRPGTADVYFAPAAEQNPVERHPNVRYVSRSRPDCMCYALAGYMAFPYVARRLRRKGRSAAAQDS